MILVREMNPEYGCDPEHARICRCIVELISVAVSLPLPVGSPTTVLGAGAGGGEGYIVGGGVGSRVGLRGAGNARLRHEIAIPLPVLLSSKICRPRDHDDRPARRFRKCPE
eukprot:CAMPEP_0198724590 /NCGR_PEP_ID=MMETSP1475-20131203/2053_1 /TAXON_ID= ORGANISM="Unidentified sp., Strain CCMP1999" /NCGR_SAMPLE_ID=MMETSP1475 /ASSEMBLY_ACC=CAM_ASM_001111 /LENGTH=110 /DNA_ID=CAMNT_0044486163 /DNA_START=500 /DNA_END=832 /DNA_ORIENTATION=-